MTKSNVKNLLYVFVKLAFSIQYQFHTIIHSEGQSNKRFGRTTVYKMLLTITEYMPLLAACQSLMVSSAQ